MCRVFLRTVLACDGGGLGGKRERGRKSVHGSHVLLRACCVFGRLPMSNVERIRAVLEQALRDAVAATVIADAEDPIAFIASRLGSKAASRSPMS